MAWMMPLSHSTSDGQWNDLDLFRLEADDGVGEPVLAELAVVGQRAAARASSGPSEGVHRLLALDHVVLEHDSFRSACRPRCCACRRPSWPARGACDSPPERSTPFDERAEASCVDTVVVALDVGLVVAEGDAGRAPEDLRALHGGEGVGDGRLDLRGGLGGRDGREGRTPSGKWRARAGHFCE